MFSKFATFVVVALGALSVSATEFSCNTGAVQCCDSLQAPAEYSAEGIAALVGVAVSTITGQVGLGCDALTVIGAGTGANCATAPVCCEHVYSNSLVGVNCTPALVGA